MSYRKKRFETLKTVLIWIWFIIFVLLCLLYPVALGDDPLISLKVPIIVTVLWFLSIIIYCVISSRINKKKRKEIEERTIVIHDQLGDFSIDPVLDDKFDGHIKWCDEENCGVYLEKDPGTEATAVKTLEILHRLCENMQDWEQRLKEYSADNSDINDEGMIEIWGGGYGENEEEPHAITKEEYMKRISICFIDISIDGELFFMYDLDGMFTDHSEAICANISGEIYESKLWG